MQKLLEHFRPFSMNDVHFKKVDAREYMHCVHESSRFDVSFVIHTICEPRCHCPAVPSAAHSMGFIAILIQSIACKAVLLRRLYERCQTYHPRKGAPLLKCRSECIAKKSR